MLEASGGQDQYYIRSVSHVPFAHLLLNYWRGKSYIPMVGDISSKQFMYIDLVVVVVVVVVVVECCCSSVIVDVQLQINNNNKM